MRPLPEMHQIDPDNVADVLTQLGWIDRSESVQATLLVGGVSNVVMKIRREKPAGGPIPVSQFVLKQARPQLAVAEPWFCRVERLEREVEVLKACQEILSRHSGEAREHAIGIPRLFCHDKQLHLYAMSLAGNGEGTWKSELLAGVLDSGRARATGWLLAALHSGSFHDASLSQQLADQQFFEALRLDPYYRRLLPLHRDLEDQLQQLIDSAARGWCLVHGDYSPKNLVTDGQNLTLIDFEVGHFGDPAFDLGFFQTHLVLKALWSGARCQDVWELLDEFQRAYSDTVASILSGSDRAALEQRGWQHLGACMLARVDGKSPVDYLSAPLAATARRLGRGILSGELDSWDTLRQQVLNGAC